MRKVEMVNPVFDDDKGKIIELYTLEEMKEKFDGGEISVSQYDNLCKWIADDAEIVGFAETDETGHYYNIYADEIGE